MIRYPISEAELRRKINEQDPEWFANAEQREKAFATAGRYDENLETESAGRKCKATPIWSRIKPVYMRLQHEKCAYCERRLSSGEWGRGEHDLEHFRPKSKAKPWKASASLLREGVAITPTVNGKHDPGYHLLAYHPLNYCAACKTCNSGLKNDLFPIAGIRHSMGDNPRNMADEEPLLLYPVGTIDTNPETLIDFHGLSPRAKLTNGFGRQRALVCISFFQLRNPLRKELYRERAQQISAVHSYLLNLKYAGDVWDRLITAYQASSSPHTNCTRSYVRLFHSNREEADEIFKLASDYLQSISL